MCIRISSLPFRCPENSEELVAFANTGGGRLLIGVKDNGKIAGIRSEEELYMIEAASYNVL